MTKHLWLQLENELQWAEVWTRAVMEHLELFCQQVWSLTGSGKVRERPWGSLSLRVLSLMGLCGPRASAETFTQACCSRVLSLERASWSGPVLIYETDDWYLLSPGPSSLLSPLGGLSLSSRTVFSVYACLPASLACVTSALGRLADASRFTGAYCSFSLPFPNCSLLPPHLFLNYFCIPVFGVIHNLLNEWGNSTCNFRHR